MSPTAKLFLVTRADLPPGQQAVQPAHALSEFMEDHPDTYRIWFKASNYLAVLAAQNEDELKGLLAQARDRGLSCSAFHEPDRDDELTAIALGPGTSAKRLTRRLPLALAS